MKTILSGFCALSTLALLTGCDAGEHSALGSGGSSATTSSGSGPGSSGAGAGTTSGSSSSGSTGTGGSSPGSGLPVPPGAGNEPAPAGAAQGLTVLPWAGFTSAVSYTFDDAQPSQVQYWPNLKAEGIRGTFYLNTYDQSFEPGFDSTWQDALASGWELGNHTVHHCYENGMCPNGDAFTSVDQELDDVTTYIKTTAKQADVWTSAYPFGDTGWETASKSRFFLSRGIYSGTILPTATIDPWNLPCIAAIAAGGEPASTFSADVDMAESQGSWLIFLFHSIVTPTNTANSWYAPTDIASITGSIDHAKSLGSVWLDTVATVGAYWTGQKLLTSATPAMSGGATTWTWSLPAHFPAGKFLRVTVEGGKLAQNGKTLTWDPHGYYEIALDDGSLTLSP
jgi:peptidoglycan/xylan/chitin deacetylase (PgdA/CDA1 family)